MRNRFIYSLALVGALFSFTACNDDDEKPAASLIGTWKGDKVEATVKIQGFPTPITDNDDDFSGVAEFKPNGIVIFREDGKNTEGSWAQNGDKLILSVEGLEEDDVSGTYTIKELNNSRLRIYIEKEATFYDEETELELLAEIKATLYFNKQ